MGDGSRRRRPQEHQVDSALAPPTSCLHPNSGKASVSCCKQTRTTFLSHLRATCCAPPPCIQSDMSSWRLFGPTTTTPSGPFWGFSQSKNLTLSDSLDQVLFAAALWELKTLLFNFFGTGQGQKNLLKWKQSLFLADVILSSSLHSVSYSLRPVRPPLHSPFSLTCIMTFSAVIQTNDFHIFSKLSPLEVGGGTLAMQQWRPVYCFCQCRCRWMCYRWTLNRGHGVCWVHLWL